jgi:hypothetical protein
MRVAGEEHLVQRSFPISNNKHVALRNLTAMDIENDQIINSAEADAAVNTTYVVV